MELNVNKEKLVVGDRIVELESLFTPEFYDYSNKIAVNYNNNFFVVNEVFLFSIQTFLALEKFVKDNGVSSVNIKNASPIIALYLSDIAEKHHIQIISSSLWFIKAKIYFHYSCLHFASFLYFLYLLGRIKYIEAAIPEHDKFAVLRQKSAINKFKEFTDISKEIEDPFSSDSIYRLYPLKTRFKWVIKSYIKSFGEIRKEKKFYKEKTGENSVYWLNDFYAKRIVHTLIYNELMNDYMLKNVGKIYYTGSNLDRYSVVEEQIANRLGIKTVCLPHGLEYGFKSPKGFSCDVFYATSDKAAADLNELYSTKKFLFDAGVTRKMYERNAPYDANKPKKVVFFTESREVYVNQQIIEGILPLFKEEGIKLYLKLHPDDKKEDYDQYHLEYLTDYNDAIIGNICFARKSTVLLEALYNHSIPLAILINSKDSSIYGTFPSLNQDKIKVTYSVKELANEIKKYL